MPKKCDVQSCEYDVFGTDKNTGKRFCRRHQYLRTDIVHSLRRKTVKERNNKLSRNKLDFDVFQYGFTDEREMFNSIWTKRPHRSVISGRDLSNIALFYSMFAHVLNKKNYPLFRYNPDNIMLLHPIEHLLVDNGSTSARKNYCKDYPQADFSIFYAKKEELLKIYPKEKLLNYGT